MKKFAIVLAFILVVSTLLSACGSNNDNGGGASSGGGGNKGGKKDFKVGMVTDTGGVNDKSFNQGAWEGLQQFAKDNHLKVGTGVKYLESQEASDYVPNLNQLVHGGYNLVFGVGYKMNDAIRQIATENKNAKLAIIDSVVTQDNGDPISNVANITFKEQEGSFLAGVVAATMTKTNKIGFVGGVKSDVISRFENGFIAGAKTVKPNIQIFDQYTGSFSDASKGQQIGSAMYSKGADIVFPAAGASGNGVFTEAKNRAKNGKKVWVIGVDRDQYKEGLPEDVTLTSMVKHVDTAVQKVSKQTMDGKFPGGKHVLLGLKQDGVGLSKHSKHISDKAMNAVKNHKQKLINGDIKAPGTKQELKKYLSSLK